MKSEVRRVLFFAEAVTLAHVARCIAIADKLYERGNYIIGLAADSRYCQVLGAMPYQQIPLHSVSSEYFAKKLANGLPIYNVNILSEYIKEDIKIIEEFRPDFIFGDFRLSLAISSKLTKVPYATITNAYWSPYAKISYPIPELLLTKICGVSIAQKLFDFVRPVVFKIHSFALNKTCKKFGLQPLSYDMRDTYTHADYTLYADIESLIPMRQLPHNHLFIGPVLWSAQIPLPAWWDLIPTDKPVIFVTLGSSGDSTLLPMILEALSQLPITTICATAKKTIIHDKYANVYATEFLPAQDAVKKSDIVICNGGSPMVYQSLIENKVIIGIPSNLDQYLMMTIIQAAKKGILIRAGKVDTEYLQSAVNHAINDASLTTNKTSAFINDNMMFSIEKIENIIQQHINKSPPLQ